MILVTGGAGYVGSILVPLLVSLGYKVRVFDSFLFGEGSLKSVEAKIEKKKGDLRQINAKILEGVEIIIHLAALSNDPMADFAPQENFAINKEGTALLVRLAKKTGVKRFIFASSCSIYDRQDLNKVPFLSENDRVKPAAYYSLSKFEAEKIILAQVDNNFCPVILRKGTIYGYSPRMRYDLVVNAMIKDALMNKQINIYAQGKEWRPLVDICDVARAYLLALETPAEKIKGQVFNIVYDNYKINKLALEIKNELEDFKMNLLVSSGGVSSSEIKIINHDNNKKLRSYRVSNKEGKKSFRFSSEDIR